MATRKQEKGERIDDYIANITRLCKRLKISDVVSMRYFIQGLQPSIQSYVILARPKDLKEAESLARMKELVDTNQAASDTQSILTQMDTMFTKLMNRSMPGNSQTIAAVSSEPTQSHIDKRFDELSRQIEQIQNQNDQNMASVSNIAAYDQPENAPRFHEASNWQGSFNREVDQLQRHINRLENDLRRYQNPRCNDSRSYEHNFDREGEPICSFCQRVGHTWRTCQQRGGDPCLSQNPINGLNRSGPSNFHQPHQQLNE